ncbi:MAG: hypothetical protein IPM98_17975 [Lewinellaceae bacterium]|nr:hypothetical protein [Lewinellaceae bacterium]
MKIISFLALVIIILSCKMIKEDIATNPDLPPPFNGPGVSRERVLAIAAKYGLQDSIAVGYKSTTLKPPPPETYQYLSEEFFDGYLSTGGSILISSSTKRSGNRRLRTFRLFRSTSCILKTTQACSDQN